jgi:hypothetical protein
MILISHEAHVNKYALDWAEEASHFQQLTALFEDKKKCEEVICSKLDLTIFLRWKWTISIHSFNGKFQI